MDMVKAARTGAATIAAIGLAVVLSSISAAQTPAKAAPDLDAEAASKEPGALWMRPLRENYPAAWAELKRRVAQGMAVHPDGQETAATSVAFQQEFLASKHAAVLRAPPRALRTDVELNTNLLRSLQHDDPTGCALFQKTGALDPADPTARTVWIQIQLSQLEGALIESAAQGDKSTQTTPAPLSKTDLSYLAKHYQALGGEKNGFFAALSPTQSTLPAADACASAVLFGTVVSQAPDEIIARYFASARHTG